MRQVALGVLGFGALVLTGCEARIDGNGISVNRNANAQIAVENAFDSLGNSVDRAGDTVANGIDRTVDEVRNTSRDAARETGNAADRAERSLEGNRTER